LVQSLLPKHRRKGSLSRGDSDQGPGPETETSEQKTEGQANGQEEPNAPLAILYTLLDELRAAETEAERQAIKQEINQLTQY